MQGFKGEDHLYHIAACCFFGQPWLVAVEEAHVLKGPGGGVFTAHIPALFILIQFVRLIVFFIEAAQEWAIDLWNKTLGIVI